MRVTPPTRREFLRRGACALAGSALAGSGFDRLGLVRALAARGAPAGYKALVCVLLDGGNDGNNTVVPHDEYNSPGGYAAVRAASGLAIPKDDLLPVSPPSQQGRKFGLHPNLPELQALFHQQKLAVLCNTGTLVRPLTRELYRAGVGHPYQLFSHSDQVDQQQTAASVEQGQTGWGGRISDLMAGVNGDSALPFAVSAAGKTSLFATGGETRQLVVSPDSQRLLDSIAVDYGPGFPADYHAARRLAFERIRVDAGAGAGTFVKVASETIGEALRARQALENDPVLPPLQAGQTEFPAGRLGAQLRQVAKLVAAGRALGLSRQIFFCSLEGFDHHANQKSSFYNQDQLLLHLSLSLKAFYDATVRLGAASDVTTFTLSDFGRTFEPSGAGAGVGSDHGWGNHHFVLGDAVRGGDFYGTFPVLALGGPDDADERGRCIPTTSVEQYAAILAAWFGLPAGDLPRVFPLIGRFAAHDLGFML